MYEVKRLKELDLEEIRRKIRECEIKQTSHVGEVESRKGRPEWKLVIKYLTDKLDTLYQVVSGRKDRLILCFYLSKKYDLRIVIRIKEKALYVITFYKYLKKSRLIRK